MIARLPDKAAPGIFYGIHPWCRQGWGGLLATFADTAPDATKVYEVKEKFGALRIYSRGSEFGSGAAKMAHAISNFVCEVCGADGRRMQSGPTVLTRCPIHQPSGVVTLFPEDVSCDRLVIGDGFLALEQGLAYFVQDSAPGAQIAIAKSGSGFEFSSTRTSASFLGALAFASNYSKRISQ